MELLKNIEFILQNNEFAYGILFFILGLCLASFFNVVIYRIPYMIEQQNAKEIKFWFSEKNISFPPSLEPLLLPFNLSFPASHCSTCKTPLKWYHNIPIISYLLLKGKCSYCSSHISLQYPLVEILGGLVLLATYLIFIPQGIFVFVAATILVSLSFCLIVLDFKLYLLPDNIIYALLWIGLFLTCFNVSILSISIQDSILGLIGGYTALWLISSVGEFVKKMQVMGENDPKLLAALGVFVGLKGVIFVALFSPFIGIFIWLLYKMLKKDTNMIPYGPALIFSTFFYIFYGNVFLHFINIS